ncbi:MAG: hypothetical protein ACRCXX_04450 [Cetobacterium sp.]|uniref:hypothetical protein n=1 Tax=Cetobacterium sp. TaxID=2071632 RepID=UPI003F3A326F
MRRLLISQNHAEINKIMKKFIVILKNVSRFRTDTPVYLDLLRGVIYGKYNNSYATVSLNTVEDICNIYSDADIFNYTHTECFKTSVAKVDAFRDIVSKTKKEFVHFEIQATIDRDLIFEVCIRHKETGALEYAKLKVKQVEEPKDFLRLVNKTVGVAMANIVITPEDINTLMGGLPLEIKDGDTILVRMMKDLILGKTVDTSRDVTLFCSEVNGDLTDCALTYYTGIKDNPDVWVVQYFTSRVY